MGKMLNLMSAVLMFSMIATAGCGWVWNGCQPVWTGKVGDYSCLGSQKPMAQPSLSCGYQYNAVARMTCPTSCVNYPAYNKVFGNKMLYQVNIKYQGYTQNTIWCACPRGNLYPNPINR